MFVCFHLKIRVKLIMVKSQSHLNINLINDCLKNWVCWYNTHKIARHKRPERRMCLIICIWAKGPWKKCSVPGISMYPESEPCVYRWQKPIQSSLSKMIRMYSNSHNLRAGSQCGPQEDHNPKLVLRNEETYLSFLRLLDPTRAFPGAWSSPL